MKKETQSQKVTKLRSHEGTITVRRTHLKYGKPVDGEFTADKKDTIQIRPFVSEPAYVICNRRFTKNLGDFNGFQITVGVSHPCYPEELSEFYHEVVDFVETALAEDPAVKYYGGMMDTKEADNDNDDLI